MLPAAADRRCAARRHVPQRGPFALDECHGYSAVQCKAIGDGQQEGRGGWRAAISRNFVQIFRNPFLPVPLTCVLVPLCVPCVDVLLLEASEALVAAPQFSRNFPAIFLQLDLMPPARNPPLWDGGVSIAKTRRRAGGGQTVETKKASRRDHESVLGRAQRDWGNESSFRPHPACCALRARQCACVYGNAVHAVRSFGCRQIIAP